MAVSILCREVSAKGIVIATFIVSRVNKYSLYTDTDAALFLFRSLVGRLRDIASVIGCNCSLCGRRDRWPSFDLNLQSLQFLVELVVLFL